MEKINTGELTADLPDSILANLEKRFFENKIYVSHEQFRADI